MSSIGIYCIETGNWSDNLTQRTSIQPALGLLNAVNEVPYFHRNASTAGEFWHFLEQWKSQGRRTHPILYFCFHGLPDLIHFSDGDVTLADLETRLEGSCAEAILYFSSCQTLKLDEERLKSFLVRTSAIAVGGYRKSVNWMESAAFELLFFSDLCSSRRIDHQSARRLKKTFDRRHSQLANNLAFRFLVGSAKDRRRGIARAAHHYRIGDTVRAYFEGVLFDPCVVEELQWVDGAPAYGVYFDTDETQVNDITEAEIAGSSDKKPTNTEAWPRPEYRRGDIVTVLYDGAGYDPCLIEDVVTKRGVPQYTIYFDADSTSIGKLNLANITGRSQKRLRNHPNFIDERAIESSRWQHGDIVKAKYDGRTLDPARVIRNEGEHVVVHWAVDDTFSRILATDLVGASKKPWSLPLEDADVELSFPDSKSEQGPSGPSKWKHGDIVKAMFDGQELEPARVIRNEGGDVVLHWAVDDTLSIIPATDVVGASRKPWGLPLEDADVEISFDDSEP